MRPLAETLQQEGVKVWFDDFEIAVGDSIVSKVEKGLANSKAGVLVISSAFLGKGWPTYEMNTLKQLYIANDVRMIPIFKGVTLDQIKRSSPGLLDIRGIDAAKRTIGECAYEIISAIRPDLRSIVNAAVVARVMEERAGPPQKISIAKIKSGPIRRDDFPERDMLRLLVLHATFQEVLSDSFADWIDSFRRDFNYEREVRVWERMAACYLLCTNGRKYSETVKVRVFAILLAFFSGTTGSELEEALAKLPKAIAIRLKGAISGWLNDWQSAQPFISDNDLSDQLEVRALIEEFGASPSRKAS